MKKLVTIIVTTALLSFSVTAKADKNDAMVEMVVNMMKQTVQLDSLSNCLGVTETNFIKAYTKTVEACIPKDGLEGNCIEELAPEILGISKAKFDSCIPDDDVAEQEEAVDYSALSEKERAALLTKQQAEGMARMEEMAALMKKSSEGTEDKISLPVYSPSTMSSHYSSGMQNSMGKTTLPVATFTTKDSVEKVVGFYKNSLPDFKIKNNMGVYYVMNKIPEDLAKLSFDTENLPLYFIPHIETYSLKVAQQDTTFIVISYKPY
ncbi:hypothetical protein [Colwellia sp. 12G3]|uniref:hypothetical protein n=1 Tax=Colwellia sp. 12G3 TaxID=2058299 RepID=UPI000C34972A|nr:hypothetical protein [Colwellia sp. 12G3]PKI12674.1 hypothetical protein CXF71_18220 [Colwellia sp. 12G3]